MNSTIQGHDLFNKAMRGLDPAEARGVRVKILKHAAEPIAERMAALAPNEPGKPDLKDNIKIQAVRSVDDPDFGGTMALDEDAAAVAIGPSKDAFYGFFQEFGTAPHQQGAGEHPGHPAQPFARPAFDEKVGEALRIAADDIWAHIRNHVSRSVTGRGL
jgi:HK97 gp10 family phage protein